MLLIISHFVITNPSRVNCKGRGGGDNDKYRCVMLLSLTFRFSEHKTDHKKAFDHFREAL